MESSNIFKPAMIIIDAQVGFDNLDYWGGSRNNPDAEQNIAMLLKHCRENSVPLFHVKHNSTTEGSLLSLSSPGNAFKKETIPMGDEVIIEKSVNSAFIGTKSYQLLANQGINTVMIAGFITEHCVSTTVRMAANLGFDTYLIEDASVSFAKQGINGEHFTAEIVQAVSVATLQGEFAQVITTARAKSLTAIVAY
jgi:nicotinamidase-related amidase